jgi:hypothetical protein
MELPRKVNAQLKQQSVGIISKQCEKTTLLLDQNMFNFWPTLTAGNQ